MIDDPNPNPEQPSIPGIDWPKPEPNPNPEQPSIPGVDWPEPDPDPERPSIPEL